MSIVIFSLTLLLLSMPLIFHNQTADPLQLHLSPLSFSPSSIHHDLFSLSMAHLCGFLNEPLPKCLILLSVFSFPLLYLFDLSPEPLNFLPTLINLVTSPLCLLPIPLSLLLEPSSLCLCFNFLDRDPR